MRKLAATLAAVSVAILAVTPAASGHKSGRVPPVRQILRVTVRPGTPQITHTKPIPAEAYEFATVIVDGEPAEIAYTSSTVEVATTPTVMVRMTIRPKRAPLLIAAGSISGTHNVVVIVHWS